MLQQRIARSLSRRPFATWAALAILLALVLGATGCQHRFRSEQIPKMKWLILPFSQPPAMSESPVTIRGFWVTARDIRQNERAGDMLADVLNRKMAHLDYLNLYSAIDLKYYFANKGRRLKKEFASLNDAEVNRMLWQVPKLEFAKDLGADKMLTGRIVRLYMGQNRTFPWWWSVLEVEIEVTDVATGKVEWTHHYNLRRQFASMMSLQEDLADRLNLDLRTDYFRTMIRK